MSSDTYTFPENAGFNLKKNANLDEGKVKKVLATLQGTISITNHGGGLWSNAFHELMEDEDSKATVTIGDFAKRDVHEKFKPLADMLERYPLETLHVLHYAGFKGIQFSFSEPTAISLSCLVAHAVVRLTRREFRRSDALRRFVVEKWSDLLKSLPKQAVRTNDQRCGELIYSKKACKKSINFFIKIRDVVEEDSGGFESLNESDFEEDVESEGESELVDSSGVDVNEGIDLNNVHHKRAQYVQDLRNEFEKNKTCTSLTREQKSQLAKNAHFVTEVFSKCCVLNCDVKWDEGKGRPACLANSAKLNTDKSVYEKRSSFLDMCLHSNPKAILKCMDWKEQSDQFDTILGDAYIRYIICHTMESSSGPDAKLKKVIKNVWSGFLTAINDFHCDESHDAVAKDVVTWFQNEFPVKRIRHSLKKRAAESDSETPVQCKKQKTTTVLN